MLPFPYEPLRNVFLFPLIDVQHHAHVLQIMLLVDERKRLLRTLAVLRFDVVISRRRFTWLYRLNIVRPHRAIFALAH